MLVIEDNLYNNYCNISLNNTCRDFLYKKTSSHNKREGRRKIQRGKTNFKIKNEGNYKTLKLSFSLG